MMRPLPRLESEPESGAIFAQLFISAALKGIICIYFDAHTDNTSVFSTF
jgi:hypothetical protein